MPNLTVQLPNLDDDPWGEKLNAVLAALIAAINGSLSTAPPKPLGPAAVAGTVSGGGAAADHVHPTDGLATQADLQDAVIGAGSVPPGRQVIAGAGLTGGGDLTSDVQLAVNFGTTPGTVMDGGTDVGAIPAAVTLATAAALLLSSQVVDDIVPRFELLADGTIAQGDAPILVANVAGTSTVTVTTAADHGYGTGDVVTIADVQSFTGATGTFTITRVDATSFTLNGATGSGTYTIGGTVQRTVGGNSGALEGVWNLLVPDTSRDGLVVRGREGSTQQLVTVRDYQGNPIFSVGPTGGAGVFSSDPHDLLFATNSVFGRTFAANVNGGVRAASGDPAGGVEIFALGNATTQPASNPDGTHLGEGSFTTAEGVVLWVRNGRLRVRTSAGHEDELLGQVNRRQSAVSAPGGDTVLLLDHTLPPVVATANITASADDSFSGARVSYTTTAASGVDAGLISPFGLIQRQWAPYFYARVRTDASSITSTRLWVGLTDSELAGLAAAPTTQHVAAFRYDTSIDGTAFWRTVTCNGTSATTTTTTSAIAVDTVYELIIEANSAGTAIRYWVNGVLVSTHTTTLPGAGATLGYTARLRTLAAASRSLRFGRIAWSQK
jgi:hypothetical protein